MRDPVMCRRYGRRREPTRDSSAPVFGTFALSQRRPNRRGFRLRIGWRSDGAPTIFPGYFHDPADLIAEGQEIGLAGEALFGIEGPGWPLGDFEEKWADPVMRERLLWLARSTERDPRDLAVSAHLLLVAHRPTL